MSEKPRYLTDEETKFDGAGEGLGVAGEVAMSMHSQTRVHSQEDVSETDYEVIRMDTEGIMIFQETEPTAYSASYYAEAARDAYRPILERNLQESTQETAPGERHTAAEYAEMARGAYFSNPNRIGTQNLKTLFWPLNTSLEES